MGDARDSLLFGAGTASKDAPALIDAAAGVRLTHGELADRAQEAAGRLAGPRGLVFLYADNTAESVIALLGAWGAGHAVALLDGSAPAKAHDLVARYRPEYLAGASAAEAAASASGYALLDDGQPTPPIWKGAAGPALHPDLFCLLSTSGSTGTPKFVRLSRAALAANARAIARALELGPGTVSCAHLAFHYSFGLSVLTSTLAGGGALALIREGFTTGEFWRQFREAGCTHLYGVPYHFEMVARLGLERLKLPSLQVCAQAGGALRKEVVLQLAQAMHARGGRFHVMYGQTEAGPRMTTLPSHWLPAKLGSVGPTLDGGRFETAEPRGARGEGELVYHGPNVMMGYAMDRADLAKGDEMGGRLPTGDIGYLDADGCVFITGRAARFAKVVGLRISLDEVEARAPNSAAIDLDGVLQVFVETPDADIDKIHGQLCEQLNLHGSLIRVRRIDKLPRRANGKLDYQSLEDAG